MSQRDGQPEASAAYTHIEAIKSRLQELRAQERAALEAEAKATAEREAVQAKLAEVAAELETAVNTPVRGAEDPTLWLPDEVLIAVFLVVPFATLWDGTCSLVCRRWRELSKTPPVRDRLRVGRWGAYARGDIAPRTLGRHSDTVLALAVGDDGTVYSGSDNHTIKVWSGVDGAHLRTLSGHASIVQALAVRGDTLYSGSYDCTVQEWRTTDGARLRTFCGHTHVVLSLATSPQGHVYSGSADKSIRVWSGDDRSVVRRLEGHTEAVYALEVGLDGTLYSGSDDDTIKVWSGDDGALLATLAGHTGSVRSLLCCKVRGVLYSGSADATVRVWSRNGWTLTRTMQCATLVSALAQDSAGHLLVCEYDREVRTWPAGLEIQGPPTVAVAGQFSRTHVLAPGPNGRVYAGSLKGTIVWY